MAEPDDPAARDGVVTSSDARLRFEQFVQNEARLMDDNRYDAWLDLWAEDAVYRIPLGPSEADEREQVALVNERRQQIEDRVARLKGRFAHAQSPRSRLMRLVSNIELEETGDGILTGTSTFVLGEIRNDRQHVYFGRSRHALVETVVGLRMREKIVHLLNSDATTGNMTFLI
jgi:3-phenylpropionate/cinnamic acid dioxygenase small subunit